MEIKVTLDENILKSLIRDQLESLIPKAQADNKMLNASEVCSMLGIHPSTLNQWKKQGKIPYKRLGKRVFFNRDEVLRSMEDRRRL